MSKTEKRASMDKAGHIALTVHLGEDGAVEELVHSYQDQLYGYALRLVGNTFDAEEVVQDAFIRACRALTARYSPDKCRGLELRPWLFRITRNLALNCLRDRRSTETHHLQATDECLAVACSGSAEPTRALEAMVNRDTLRRALEILDTGSRELVVLRFIEGLSYAEIAGIIGASAAAARAKVFRALRRLRELMTEGGPRCVVKQ